MACEVWNPEITAEAGGCGNCEYWELVTGFFHEFDVHLLVFEKRRKQEAGRPALWSSHEKNAYVSKKHAYNTFFSWLDRMAWS